ncbi:hypothetical protein [Hymenobacter cavernae]|uniref:DUF4157 domain-containing protein n=1 Tax=Hymenobacter cavernae TaxID=2044852 RepID=A0ABQ1UG25_9BACT|nr:hypothetical protein [Hymenobacter cavernae]GGF16511.1 hypothetical protein GCM10011383_29900 [Hymenobacter cavernae]
MKPPRILPNSPFARIARRVLGSSSVAMVLGNTIHLSGATKEEFLCDPYWVAHEMCHIQQFREHGYLAFLWKYLVESARVGYYNNKYEAEARLAGQRDAQLYAHNGVLPDPATMHRGAGEPT